MKRLKSLKKGKTKDGEKSSKVSQVGDVVGGSQEDIFASLMAYATSQGTLEYSASLSSLEQSFLNESSRLTSQRPNLPTHGHLPSKNGFLNRTDSINTSSSALGAQFGGGQSSFSASSKQSAPVNVNSVIDNDDDESDDSMDEYQFSPIASVRSTSNSVDKSMHPPSLQRLQNMGSEQVLRKRQELEDSFHEITERLGNLSSNGESAGNLSDYDEHIEAQLLEVREELTKKNAEVEVLRSRLNEKHGSDQMSKELQQTKLNLDEAHEEIHELQKERERNMVEIASLSKQLVSAQTAASKTHQSEEAGDYQELQRMHQESQSKVFELEALLDAISKEHVAKAHKYTGADSVIDYTDRILVLEKRLEVKDRQLAEAVRTRDEEIDRLRADLKMTLSKSSTLEVAANQSSSQIEEMESHINVSNNYQLELQAENEELRKQLEEVETRLAEVEDSQWMREQKFAGIQTMYDESQKKIAELEGVQKLLKKAEKKVVKLEEKLKKAKSATKNVSSNSNHDSYHESLNVEPEDGDAVALPSNEELEKTIAQLSKKLSKKVKKIELLSSELEASHERELASLVQMETLQNEKDALQTDLMIMEQRISDAEGKLNIALPLPVDFEAADEASRNKIAQLEAEKKALEKQVKKVEKKLAKVKSVDEDEVHEDLKKELNSSKSIILSLQKELSETKAGMEQMMVTLDEERQSHGTKYESLMKELGEAQSQLSIVQKQFERFIRKEPEVAPPIPVHTPTLVSTQTLDNLTASNVALEAELQDLRRQLGEKNEQLRKKEEEYYMQADQVDGLRERLQEALSNLEDVEYERNFNTAKVQELTKVNGANNNEDDIRDLLQQKAVQIAELETKLQKAEREVDECKAMIEKLEQEKSGNQEKVAELSAVWENQAKENAVRNQILKKALEVAEQLNQAVQQIEVLENEKERAIEKSRVVSVQLSKSIRKTEELSATIEKLERKNIEMSKLISDAGLDKKSPAEVRAAEQAQELTIRMLVKKIEQLDSEKEHQIDLAKKVEQLEAEREQLSGTLHDLQARPVNRTPPPVDMFQGMMSMLDDPDQTAL